MPNSPIHSILAEFQDEVIAVLESGGFFDIEGQYDAAALYASIPKRDKQAYIKASDEKNSRIWDIVKGLIVGKAISAGISAFGKSYPMKVKPSAQDYMNRYVKEHGGKFITNMGRTDQKKLVGFIWSNAGVHERPLARKIDQQPHLRWILDQGWHRNETIVRTEKARATEYGTYRTAKDNGFKKKVWITAGDKRVRPSHRAMNGERVGISETFSNGLEFPFDINCRCRVRYEL